MQKHILSALVENKSGVLAHLSGLFSARGFNIDSLAVGETEDPQFSRMTIVVAGDEAILEQVRKQIAKLINVVKVLDMSGTQRVERDLALIRVSTPPDRRGQVLELVRLFRAKVIDVGQDEVVIEAVGSEEKLEGLLDLLRPQGIIEMVRTGRIALARSPRA
ncbi:MAG: acetolactate synthase small subunit [Candidatus Brocadiia bacterium]|jgi:acetolactate synthase-1/3 small subunit|nr:acetolactate synthase small subunit [Candidatus Brocadiia bacterium]